MTPAAACPSVAAMVLLGHGVPLSLLLDIVLGPRSEELLAVEVPSARQPAE